MPAGRDLQHDARRGDCRLQCSAAARRGRRHGAFAHLAGVHRPSLWPPRRELCRGSVPGRRVWRGGRARPAGPRRLRRRRHLPGLASEQGRGAGQALCDVRRRRQGWLHAVWRRHRGAHPLRRLPAAVARICAGRWPRRDGGTQHGRLGADARQPAAAARRPARALRPGRGRLHRQRQHQRRGPRRLLSRFCRQHLRRGRHGPRRGDRSGHAGRRLPQRPAAARRLRPGADGTRRPRVRQRAAPKVCGPPL